MSYEATAAMLPSRKKKRVQHIHPSMATESVNEAAQAKNRLAKEKSPYLLQHASNPVDWYPWSQEAFDKAVSEDKMIFLSVGYSTCHWCHVMERESFENEEIGKILNENYVAIKVDREERPDVDKVYMTFVQATSGGGGWPMSVWMTPDRCPVIGGTYFPPDDRYFGRPGFKTLLLHIDRLWKNKRQEVMDQGNSILEALSQVKVGVKEGEELALPGVQAIHTCYSLLDKSYDDELGGFGKEAPKFPQPVNLNFMLRYYANNSCKEEGQKALEESLYTLTCMAKGGIYDHVSQGFHRYSTDKFWHVPHFEKMLYDQGQLLTCYSEAYQITKEERYAEVARNIIEYVTRDLQSPAGGFYSAEDADSLPTEGATAKKEGAFCVWTQSQVDSLLGEEVKGHPGVTLANVFCHHYGVKPEGNVDPFQDPHDELTNQNVLIERGSVVDTAKEFGLTEDLTLALLNKGRHLLYTARQTRPRPHLDNKMVAAWNGMMISGLAKAGQALGEEQYTQQAERAAEFLRQYMYKSDVLLRTTYCGLDEEIQAGPVDIEGFADDYALVIKALLDLYETNFDTKWLEWAEQLQEKQNSLFWDSEDGAYFNSSRADKSIVLRLKDDQDGAEPSSNSVAANNLLRLSSILQRADYKGMAMRIFRVFHQRLTNIPIAVPEMTSGLFWMTGTTKQIVLVGDPSSPDMADLVRCVNSHFLPNKVILLVPTGGDSFLSKRCEFVHGLPQVQGKATAYVCENYTCSLPVITADSLHTILDTKSAL
ncbi:spermatogenesis-associated protein 20-like isoform X2 [Mizuhopecten yessoensis]|uniref:spermatogenesis-associated protein 20-like isoform X2 n=1 Tax=Mizuhopecten yessoensis TaxID=6573 RepID=UPI000B45C6FC|nr:spermatogenesis-associated protein 20-like isoform X2 [Mizuhopecten yessoensis]